MAAIWTLAMIRLAAFANLHCVSSASTAAGLMSRHVKELETFLTEAFA